MTFGRLASFGGLTEHVLVVEHIICPLDEINCTESTLGGLIQGSQP